MRISVLDIKYDVFLSHNSADKAAVEVLGNRLRQDGLRVFLDKWNLVPGGAWQQELADALEQSACTAIFLGPAGQGPWHNEELQVALHRAVRTRNDYRVIPVLLPGAEPSQIDGFLELRTWVDFRPGLGDELAYRRLVAGIKGEPPDETSYELPDLPRPYRGLDRFEADHQQFFFGREEDSHRLVEKLRTSHFVAVIGASGSGKSSLVRAGLLPQLARDAIPNSSQWRTLVVVPGDDPIRAIAIQLARDVPRTDRTQIVSDLVRQMDGAEGGLRDTLTTWYADSPQPLLLVIDQFEEVFTHATAAGGAEKQQRFLAELAGAVNRPGQPLRIVITLRADFLDRALKFPDLKDLLQDRQFLLGELSVDALREAIVRPAQAVGAFFETGLVNLILRDVAGQPGVLPLLQHALDELWRARRGPWLTVAAYEDSGGVRAALHRRAQQTYEQLGSETQRGLARHILVRLASLREGLVETRRRAQRDELYPAGVSREEVNTVIEALAGPAARLIRTDEDTVEVTHEALIQNWSTLRSWLEEDRQALRVHRRLTDAAQEWQREAKQEAHLYHADSARLAEGVERFEQDTDPNLQAALCLAVASAKDVFDAKQRRRMASRLAELAGSPQATVHSSANYALTTWEPKAGTHEQPPKDKHANWRQVRVRSGSGSGAPQVITMLEIPAGILVRHDERNNKTRNELPIPEYWMADCELPVAVYALFLEDRPEMRTSPNCDPEQTRNQTESEHPVRKVCWLDAIEFCNWLSQRQGLAPCYESAAQDLWRCNFAADGFRLPTEAEWEYACRARSTTRFCFGDAEESASSYAWTIKNSRQEVQPVRQRLPNAWGLFDMHGNVAEWCWDKYWSYPDQSEIDRRVQAGLHPYQGVVPENTGPFRVARGGMSNDYEYDVTSSSRTRHEPTACESRIGFRVVQAWPRQPE